MALPVLLAPFKTVCRFHNRDPSKWLNPLLWEEGFAYPDSVSAVSETV
jgi:hypothetical protein